MLITLLAACVSGPGLPRPGQVAAFVPRPAEPDRKQKILAVAPRLDEQFRKYLVQTRATALVAGIVVDGELVYARGFGVADVRTGAPVDVDTVFRIASMTKSFTAAAVLKLRDEGKVSLEAPAAAYLPELEAVPLPTRDSPAITVRHLLTNASGLAFDDSWGVVSFGTEFDLVRSAVDRLLERWDPDLARRTFDAQSLRFAWMSTLPEDFARLANAHGACRPTGRPRMRSRTEGTWRLECERGAIQFTAALSPAAPAQTQLLSFTEDFPPDRRLGEAAARLADAIGRPAAPAGELFAPTSAGERARRNLAHLSVERDGCLIDGALASDGRRRATYRLRCARAAIVELTFALDEASGDVTELVGRPPLEPDPLCVP